MAHMTEKFFDVKELQQVLRLSERTIFRLLKDGDLTGFKIGREWRFTQADIDAYIDLQRRRAEEERRKAEEKKQAPHDDISEDEARPLVCSVIAA